MAGFLIIYFTCECDLCRRHVFFRTAGHLTAWFRNSFLLTEAFRINSPNKIKFADKSDHVTTHRYTYDNRKRLISSCFLTILWKIRCYFSLFNTNMELSLCQLCFYTKGPKMACFCDGKRWNCHKIGWYDSLGRTCRSTSQSRDVLHIGMQEELNFDVLFDNFKKNTLLFYTNMVPSLWGSYFYTKWLKMACFLRLEVVESS